MIVTDLSKSFNPYPKKNLQKTQQKSAEKKKNTAEIKKKSSKLAKLERQRDKDIIKSGKCEYCSKYSERLDPHEVYGGSNRKRSIKYKFVKLICPECHKDEEVIKQLRIDTQKEYERTHTREKFIEVIGKSYL